MGYYEQIGVANMRHEQRRAEMDPARRLREDRLTAALWGTAAAIACVLVLFPIIFPLIVWAVS